MTAEERIKKWKAEGEYAKALIFIESRYLFWRPSFLDSLFNDLYNFQRKLNDIMGLR
ncbi:MAG: hypothetical protein IJQ72_01075 [Bacilli bacterium]|nr:hypothetical protein [Bacilli bacterium]